MTLTATGRLTANTNEVKELEHSVELCCRAVADNEKEWEQDNHRDAR